MSLTTSVLQGGTNSFETTSEMVNFPVTDFICPGVTGHITATSGVAPTTGSFSINAQGTPDMTVAVGSGGCYVTGTPTSGNSQLFRVKNSASTNVTISANSTGGTRYDFLYVKVDPDKLKDPASDASDVATLVTSRSTSSTTDNGTPPTYGTLIAVITVSNGASSISNGNIADKRINAAFRNDNASSEVNFLSYASAATGNAPTISATGDDTNISLNLATQGTGEVRLNGTGISGAWTDYTPTITGFSVAPSYTCRYKQIGKIVYFQFRTTTNGTSNSTSFTITTPIASNNSHTNLWIAPVNGTDGSTNLTSAGLAYITHNSSTISLGKDFSGASWTSSGAKGATFLLIYEAA